MADPQTFLGQLVVIAPSAPEVLADRANGPFVAGREPWPGPARADWKGPAFGTLVATVIGIVAGITILTAGPSPVVAGVGFGAALLVFGFGSTSVARFGHRRSPAAPSHVVAGTVTHLGVRTRLGARTVTVGYRSPQSGLERQARFTLRPDHPDRDRTVAGTTMWVLHFDDARAEVV